MICPSCGSDRLVKAGKSISFSRSRRGNPKIDGSTQRYKCMECNKSTIKPLVDASRFIADTRLVTIKIDVRVANRLIEKSKLKEFSNEYNEIIKKLLDLDDKRIKYEVEKEGFERSMKIIEQSNLLQ